ncbi:MAG: polysaccharide deacetylase family protein [Bacteroidota bacterium]|nr:polysaccharide deacetylase family protein [Bacteroidota bacterium]
MKGQILLSFDVEEFDIPLEYGYNIPMDEQIKIGKKGLDALMPVLAAEDIRTTLFITANFAKHFPEEVHRLAEQHEIASHTYFHSTYENGDLLKSKQVLEALTEQPVTGLRMPRMRQPDMAEVTEAGFLYDASLNPTWIPGRYNNLKTPRLLHMEHGIYRVPASVSPNFRLPLFWLAFKNYPYAFFKKLCLDCLKADGYLCLYFHPWEFVDITTYNLPRYVKRLCGLRLLERLQHLIADLKKEGDFITMNSFIQMNVC